MATQTAVTEPAEPANTGGPMDHTAEKPTPQALEAQNHAAGIEGDNDREKSVFKALGWLDRFLAIWIFLAMLVGILLGNFVPETGSALQKGKFVGVSVPIGKQKDLKAATTTLGMLTGRLDSHRVARDDVPDSLQGAVRVVARDPGTQGYLEADLVQCLDELDCGAVSNGT